jgi:hypothetical protein
MLGTVAGGVCTELFAGFALAWGAFTDGEPMACPMPLGRTAVCEAMLGWLLCAATVACLLSIDGITPGATGASDMMTSGAAMKSAQDLGDLKK